MAFHAFVRITDSFGRFELKIRIAFWASFYFNGRRINLKLKPRNLIAEHEEFATKDEGLLLRAKTFGMNSKSLEFDQVKHSFDSSHLVILREPCLLCRQMTLIRILNNEVLYLFSFI